MTREEAIQKHREMWTAMSEEISNDSIFFDRAGFKHNYLTKNKEKMRHNCYLCDFSGENCDRCPINWCDKCEEFVNGKRTCGEVCCMCECGGNGITWQYAQILEIANLPEREVTE